MRRFVITLSIALFMAAPIAAQFVSSGGNTTTPDNVGIAMTTAPAGALDVNGTTRLRGNIFLGAPLGLPGKIHLWPDPSGSRIEGTSTGMILFGMGGLIQLVNANTLIQGFEATSAGAALHVRNVSSKPLIYARNDGRVGIGTTTPATTLHVTGANFGVSTIVNVDRAALTADGAVVFRTVNEPLTQWMFGKSANNGNENLVFGYPDFNPINQRLVVKPNGNVGIGVADPQHKLHVAGSVVATGTIHSVYQDLAEWVPATTEMEPGTVVVLNTGRSNEVMPSHAPYDTAVAGVVAAMPGILLGIGGEGQEQIATTGRVRVRVDARRLPIRVGDLLVTSELSGAAMRSEPMQVGGRAFHQPGTIIGKALEPLEGGVGEVLVLLSMQ